MGFLLLFILGLCLGSFVNALVWRLHQQNTSKKDANKNIDLSVMHGRSMCPHCRHKLALRDLVPVFSWLSLKGMCRYCHKPIGWQYPVVEVLTAVLFVLSAAFWPHGLSAWSVAVFGLWLTLLTVFMALTVYDLRWMILPDKLVFVAFCMSLVITTITLIANEGHSILAPVWGVLCIAGLFYVLYQASKGTWIGGGDVKLGVVLGTLVWGPTHALMVVFIASVLGSVVGIPMLLLGKGGKKTKLPFGPLLIASTIIVFLFGASIVSWYEANLLRI